MFARYISRRANFLPCHSRASFAVILSERGARAERSRRASRRNPIFFHFVILARGCRAKNPGCDAGRATILRVRFAPHCHPEQHCEALRGRGTPEQRPLALSYLAPAQILHYVILAPSCEARESRSFRLLNHNACVRPHRIDTALPGSPTHSLRACF